MFYNDKNMCSCAFDLWVDKLHIFTCYAFVVCLFVLNSVKYTNILKIIVLLFGNYKYMYYICIVIIKQTT